MERKIVRHKRMTRERLSLPVRPERRAQELKPERERTQQTALDDLPRMQTTGFVARESVRPASMTKEPIINDKQSRILGSGGFITPRKRRPHVVAYWRKRSSKSYADERGTAFARSWMLKAAICAAVAVMLWGLSTAPWPWAQSALNSLQAAVGRDSDMDEILGRLKLVEDALPDDAVEALSPVATETITATATPSALTPTPTALSNSTALGNADTPPLNLEIPLEGKVITSFGASMGGGTTSKGIQIEAAANAAVRAGASGRVVEIGQEENGQFLVIAHEGGWQTRYGGLSEVIVKPGDTLNSGQQIGKTAGKMWLWVALYDRYYDPLEVLNPDYIRKSS